MKFEGLDIFVHSSGKSPVEGHGVLVVHGYGDIVVKTPFARLIAVLLGLIGIIFSGIMVAGAIRAVEKSLKDLHIT